MSKRGTTNQQRADEFDRRLFGLITQACGFGCKDMTHNSYIRTRWTEVERALYRVRPLVREMMHEKDREGTS
jgi:hypothetical protein